MECFLEGVDSNGILSASAIAIVLAKGRSAAEVDYLANLFETIGQNLSLIASQTACRQLSDTNSL